MSGAPVGIVLSGGGARGAYEAGVVAGIVEVLGRRASDPSPFRVVSGTSVGAINGAFLVANAHRGDLEIERLLALWTGLRVSTHLRVDPLGLLGGRDVAARFAAKAARLVGRGEHEDEAAAVVADRLGRSLLDPRALEHTVRNAVRWEAIHENVAGGHVDAFVIAALHIATGRTTLFAELAPGRTFTPTRHPRLAARTEAIDADHVLASAAIPLLFPARRVGPTFYCDGGLRFNTPIAPAIRAGARKLCVVSLRHEPIAPPQGDEPGAVEQYPDLFFLVGKLLNALLLDPVAYDLQVLERFNRLMSVLEGTLDEHELDRVAHVLEEARGMRYRRIETLVFTPSEDIGRMAGEHLRAHLPRWELTRATRWALEAATKYGWESDAASYLLFDGAFAEKLVALGRRDAVAQADAIRRFFG